MLRTLKRTRVAKTNTGNFLASACLLRQTDTLPVSLAVWCNLGRQKHMTDWARQATNCGNVQEA